MTFTKKQAQEARKQLLDLFDENDIETVQVMQKHVTRSGMTRYLRLYIIIDGELRNITHLAAKAMQDTYSEKYEAIKVGGVGANMHFATVYNLSCTLYCPDEYNSDAAYKLSHRTL